MLRRLGTCGEACLTNHSYGAGSGGSDTWAICCNSFPVSENRPELRQLQERQRRARASQKQDPRGKANSSTDRSRLHVSSPKPRRPNHLRNALRRVLPGIFLVAAAAYLLTRSGCNDLFARGSSRKTWKKRRGWGSLLASKRAP